MHAIVFDIDGTLIQSASVDDALYKDAVRSVLGPVRFRPSQSDYEFVTDSGILRQILTDNSIPATACRVSEIKSRFVGALTEHIASRGPFAEVPGARRFMASLRSSRDSAVAIATGGWREPAVLKLESAGFDCDGLTIATSDDSHERTAIMQTAVAKLGNGFRSVTYYGDGPWDRDACAILGWRFVAVGPALSGIDAFPPVERI